jgi:curved DNA-binding protein CbpA
MFMIDLGTQSYYSVLGVTPSANIAAIRSARDTLVNDLARKMRTAETDAEKLALEVRQKEINAAGETLVRPDKREEYDRAHAHLRFFTVRVASVPMFTDKADGFFVLHRAISEFLAAKGLAVAPLSDLEAQDFLSDETPNDLLENLLR